MNLDNQITLDCAFRYALGRMTYVTEAVSNVIIECWDALPFSKKEMIVAEIKKAIEEKRIGMECDRIAWQRIVLLHEAVSSTKNEISCQCPERGSAIMDDSWYSEEEKSGMFHEPNECPCRAGLKRYKRNGKEIWLCSCCNLSTDVEIIDSTKNELNSKPKDI